MKLRGEPADAVLRVAMDSSNGIASDDLSARLRDNGENALRMKVSPDRKPARGPETPRGQKEPSLVFTRRSTQGVAPAFTA